MNKREQQALIGVILAVIGGIFLLFKGIFSFVSIPNKKRKLEEENQKKREEEQEKKKQANEKKEYLDKKYNNSELVEKILNQTVWLGQTSEQVIDTLGEPEDTDEKVLKTKKKETWKYFQTGKNRYAFKVFIENGKVIGWDEKL